MRDANPFQPPRSQHIRWPRPATTGSLDWPRIGLAVGLRLLIACGLGFAVGIVGLFAAFAFPVLVDPWLDSGLVSAVAFGIGFVPTVCGAVYLAQGITSRWLLHSLLYAAANVVVSIGFMLLPAEDPTSWRDILFCVLEVPVSVAVAGAVSRGTN